jgi:hypothetical protein
MNPFFVRGRGPRQSAWTVLNVIGNFGIECTLYGVDLAMRLLVRQVRQDSIYFLTNCYMRGNQK